MDISDHRDALARLAALHDPVGVLSVYMDTSPERASGASPQWRIALKNGLRDVRERLKTDEAHERWAEALSQMEALEPELEALANAAGEGRGRALFAPLSGGAPVTVRLQLPLPDLVVAEPTAHLLPLANALEQARPTGVVAVGRNGVRAVDWRGREPEEVFAADIEPATGDWRRLAGPAGQNAGSPQSRAPQHDLYEERLEQHQIRGAESIAGDLGQVAAERGWERILVAGDPRLADPFAAALPDAATRIIRSERLLEWQTPAELVEAVAPELAEARREEERALVTDAKDRAGAGAAGAVGLSDVLAALAEGRVDRLLIDPTAILAGHRAPDGRLAAPGEVPAGCAPSELVDEPRLAERMIEAAFATSAALTPLQDEAARLELEPVGGVAALLRW